MGDPSVGVPPQLLNHVHLISSYHYPKFANQLLLDQVLDFLVQAPRVIREVAGVAWQYLNCPPDGSVCLVWQPTTRMNTEYSTDGYVWAGPEKTFRTERRGYTIEIFTNESGYNPQVDSHTVHRRMRYRLVAAQTPQPVDSALELVHYMAAAKEQILSARDVQVPPYAQKLLAERRYLESQGHLPRKEFMLHDRHNWPTINIPGGQMQAAYPQQGGMFSRPGMPPGHNLRNSGPPMGFQQPPPGRPPYGPGQTPNRRPGPGQVPGPNNRMLPGPPGRFPTMAESPYDAVLEEEENPSSGDLLDMLTPRDISTTRYTQHHEWMEEIFSSPYSANQIVPMALGLGLPGELSKLTEGLLQDPAADVLKTDGNGIASSEYHAIGKDKVSELERRVESFLKRGEEQLQEMRAEHAKRIAELSQGQTFGDLEKKLANAGWDAEGQTNASVQGIVRQLEASTNNTISARKEVVRMQEGGLIQDLDQVNGMGMETDNLLHENGDWNMEGKDGEFDALQFAHLDGHSSGSNASPAQLAGMAGGQNGTAAPQKDGVNNAADAPQAPGPAQSTATTAAADGNAEMDLDLPEPGSNANADVDDIDVGDPSDWIMVDEPGEGNIETSTAQTSGTNEQKSPGVSDGTTAAATSTNPDPAAESTAVPPESAQPATDALAANDFDDFTNLDTAGEALEGYERAEDHDDNMGIGVNVDDDDLGLDLEPSAFGDAFEDRDEAEHEGEDAGLVDDVFGDSEAPAPAPSIPPQSEVTAAIPPSAPAEIASTEQHSAPPAVEPAPAAPSDAPFEAAEADLATDIISHVPAEAPALPAAAPDTAAAEAPPPTESVLAAPSAGEVQPAEGSAAQE